MYHYLQNLFENYLYNIQKYLKIFKELNMHSLRQIVLLAVLLNPIMFLYGKGSTEGNLDRAIDSQGQYLLGQVPSNSILAIIGISSGSEDLSKYITEGLTSYVVNNNTKNIRIAERGAMQILQKEIDFQYSGAADDNFMISLGKTVGANTVIAGTIYSIGSELRFNIRVIEIETTLVLASNGIDFEADKKTKSLLNGGAIEEILSRDNIPVRQSDGSISRANQELRESQRRAVNNTMNFLFEDYFDREPRWLIGYNYFPDFPVSIEGGYLRNGLGFYIGIGLEPKNFENNYAFSYIGEPIGAFNYYFGITYPLYFNWLWITGGGEMCVVDIAVSYTNYQYLNNYYTSEQKMVFNPSIGVYLSFKRFYMTVKYRHLFYGNSPHSFMSGLGICL
jgi:TolB-like protein